MILSKLLSLVDLIMWIRNAKELIESAKMAAIILGKVFSKQGKLFLMEKEDGISIKGNTIMQKLLIGIFIKLLEEYFLCEEVKQQDGQDLFSKDFLKTIHVYHSLHLHLLNDLFTPLCQFHFPILQCNLVCCRIEKTDLLIQIKSHNFNIL